MTADDTGSMDFTGKVVVVTGSSSGIGEACVPSICRPECGGSMVDRKPDNQQMVADLRQKGAPVEHFEADLSSRAEVERTTAAISRVLAPSILSSAMQASNGTDRLPRRPKRSGMRC